MEQFDFRTQTYLKIGVERECFLLRNGRITPIAPEIIPKIDHPGIGYELSACQLEYRIGPVSIDEVATSIEEMELFIFSSENRLDFGHSFIEVAPDDIPLDIYPDPSGRYQRVAAEMPLKVLLAACQVTGTHIHVGMPNPEVALRTYNQVVPACERLCELGDGSSKRRLMLYREVEPDPVPQQYDSWEHFHEVACDRGFAQNPRNCWDLIRISKHGTLEFRMFGATSDIGRIVSWAQECYKLCLLNG